jgi:ubiquitin carboxyl-terminal hydrolase 34
MLQVAAHVLTEQTCNLIENLISSLSDIMSQVNVQATACKLNGDLRALALVYNSDVPLSPSEELISTIDALLDKTKLARKQAVEADVAGERFMILVKKNR